jgi:hypothetical protein
VALWDAEASLYDVMRAVQVTVGGLVGTATEAFTFDAPVASFAGRNHVLSSRGSVTVSGLSFGLSEHTSSLAVGLAECSTSSWSSSTTIRCLNSAAHVSFPVLDVSVSASVGTGLDLFTFDGMVCFRFECGR